MIPIIEHEVVNSRGWVNSQDFLDLLTIAQSAPGPISLNTSVFVGYKVSGYKGAFVAVTGVVLPCFLIMLFVVYGYSYINENQYVMAAFKGLRPIVVALMTAPVIRFCKSFKLYEYAIAVFVAILIWYFKVSAVYILLLFLVIGVIRSLYSARKKGI